MRRPFRAATCAIALATAVAGCGSDRGLSDAARAELVPLVQRVERAAAAHDRPGAARALADLQRAVAASERAGDTGATRAAEIMQAAELVQRELALLPTTTTTTTTTTPTTEPVGDGHGHGKKHGKGKGDNGD